MPLTFGARVIGVIVISKLGLDQFDGDDLRVLEVLAGHASVALENARLYEAQRREAESAKALLEFARDVAEAEGIAEVADRVVAGLGAHPREPEHVGLAPGRDDASAEAARVGLASAARGRGPDVDSGGAPRALARHAPSRTSSAPRTTPPSPPRPRTPTGASRSRRSWSRGAGASSPPRLRVTTTFADRELELLGGLAQQAKLALRSAVSYETLERTFLSTVEALANALEANDEYTSTHARWITDLALKVGVELGLEQKELKRLELAALFHDIGKIGIPSHDPPQARAAHGRERAIIETHPVLGERILAPIGQLDEVRRIVRSCHERFDGSGYPDGLAGADVPIESRIVFACDAFHAMTTDRPYRRALDVAEARERLVAASGTQFDPQVVEALLQRPRRGVGASCISPYAPAASARRRPRNAHVQKQTPIPIAIANAPRTCGASPATNPRPVSSRYVSGLSGGDRLDPALEQLERHVDRREEQDEEDGHLHERRGLDRAEPHRDPAGPEEPAEVHEQREPVQPDDVDGAAADLHARRRARRS